VHFTQGTISEAFARDLATERVAHRMVALFSYVANVPFNAFDSEVFYNMAKAIERAGPNYKPLMSYADLTKRWK